MADEIVVTTGLTVNKDYLTHLDDTLQQAITMTGTRQATIVQDIGTTYEQVNFPSDFASGGAKGIAMIQNLDPTNYLEIGLDTGSGVFMPLLKLKPGERFPVRFSNVSIYAKANTGACKLKVTAFED